MSTEQNKMTANEVGKYLRETGLFTFIQANMTFTVPPLCITKSQIDERLQIIDQAFYISDKAEQV